MTTPASVRYEVSVVGSRGMDRITDPDRWREFLQKAWEAIGLEAVANITDEIGSAGFKNPTGNLQKAVSWMASTYALLIYMDPKVAPYAVYQERGVHEHVMTYLLTTGDSSARPIPIGPGVYRWATRRWMGIPHPYTDLSDSALHQPWGALAGAGKIASGWRHPGYPGKRYFRKGIVRTLDYAAEQFRTLIFRMSED